MDTTSCAHCGQQVTHRSDRPRKYCSMTCRNADKRREIECPACGTRFTRKASSKGKYCSIACSPGRPADPEKYVDRVCPGCGKTYSTPLWRFAVYCSSECRTQSATVASECLTCGEPLISYKSWPKKFCSQRCYGKSRSKGGKVYYGGNWATQRAKAMARDGGCVDCGRATMLHVHHLTSAREFDGDWEAANRLDNLVTVCRDCHLVRHGGMY